MKVKNFFAELKRRKVYRVAVAYAVLSWLLIQIATQTFPFFEIPTWAVRLVIVLLALGFPVALLLAWAFELTPEGIKRTDELDTATAKRADVPKAPASVAVPAPEKSIAVLPFENLSDSQENEYFADGIQDDVLANLAKIADLKVISRTSVRQYRTGVRNLREIGDALGVAHILEGTVRRAGNRVRVNVQLINARTDAHIWADTFDRELLDLFALQSELAEKISVALRANLSPQEKASLRIHSTADLEAYENYLRARDLFRWSGAGDPRENGEKALRFLERAVARDPQFALAYCQISRWHTELYWFGYDRKTARLEQGKGAAETALRLQPDLGDAHLALAYYHYFGFRDYDRARAELEIARRTTPNDAEVWDAAGSIDRRQGRWEASLANFEKARELDPRNVSVIWNLSETYALLGHFPAAERTIADGMEVNPNAHFFSLERATIELRRTGQTAPMYAALRKTPREFDPGGGVTLAALRLSLMDRDYKAAARLLAGAPHERFNDTGLGGTAGALDGYSFPRSWYEGLVARGLGQKDEARRAFEATRREVEADLGCCADDAKATTVLGLVHAALGEKENAIREGEQAAAMLPVSLDAYDGPIIATNLAVIYAQAGEKDLAMSQLEELRGLPTGPTPGMLGIEPEWDPLRGDPRFEKLVSSSELT
jgi:TolB-like protein/Flp pilus assembly protein TadD